MSDLQTLVNQAVQADENALLAQAAPVLNPEKYSAAVFEPFRKQLAKAKRESAKTTGYDITTTAGMGIVKGLRASFRDIRTSAENARKERKAPIIQIGKLIDAKYKELEAEIEPFESLYDGEIKAEEARKEAEKQRKLAEERARVEAIENRLAHIRGAASRLASASSDLIAKEVEQWTLLRLDPADYQEFLEDALTAVNTTLDQLANLHAIAVNREEEARRIEAERKELERLRAEQAERERIAAEERAERERAAQAERDAAAAREQAMRDEMEAMLRKMAEMQAAAAATALEASNALKGAEGQPVRMVSMESLVTQVPEAPAEIPVELPIAELRCTQMTLVDDAPSYAKSPRPTDGEIIELLSITYEASEDTVTGWLVDLVKGMEQ